MNITYWSGPGTQVTEAKDVGKDKAAALKTLKQILGTTQGHFFKIGITGNPRARQYSHGGVEIDRRVEGDMTYITLWKGVWTTMHVIYQVVADEAPVDAQKIRDVEIEFIEFAFDKHGYALKNEHKTGQDLFTFNMRAGGGGPLSPKGPYYLYVLRNNA